MNETTDSSEDVAAKPSTTRTITLEILRYNPEKDEEPSFQSFDVPCRDDWVVLDGINYIKDEVDGSLSYRWSCCMGVCGSCGMMINGEPKLSCHTFLKEYYPGPVRIEPLENFPIEKDLIIDMDGFIDKMKRVKTWLIPEEELPVDAGENIQSPAQLTDFKQYSMCINCMLCYSACPVFGEDSDFIGPAAIALAQRYNLDSRDGGEAARLDEILSEEGVWCCTFVGECSQVCPKQVDPAGAIQRAKVKGTVDWFTQWLLPKKGKS